MAASFTIAPGLCFARKADLDLLAELALVISVVVPTAVWVAVAFLTPTTDREMLQRFYRLIRPSGRGWAQTR